MSDRRLQVFHTVARLLSFTKAAEALHMTQPAVTFQVRQLEEELATRLFDRTHNRISLTEAGQTVYQYSSRIFELYSEMQQAVREITGEAAGMLIVGASMTVAEYMLPSLFGDFRGERPDLTLRLKVADTAGVVSMVENNVIDLGVVEGPIASRTLAVETCRSDRLMVITPPSHPLAKAQTVSPIKLSEYPYISCGENSEIRTVIRDYLRRVGADPTELNVVMELASAEAVKGAVEAGIGIAIVSRACLDKELQLGTLAARDLDPPLERIFSFVHQKHRFRQHATDELLQFARRYCEEHASPSPPAKAPRA